MYIYIYMYICKYVNIIYIYVNIIKNTKKYSERKHQKDIKIIIKKKKTKGETCSRKISSFN